MAKTLSSEEIYEFKRQICIAGEALFSKHGWRGVTMRDLAHELGVSPMTPYRYFKDREEILAAVKAAAFDRFSAQLENAFASEDTAKARSKAMGQAYFAFAMEEPNAYRLIFDLNQPNEQQFPELQEQSKRARQALEIYAKDLIDAGLAPPEPDLVTYALWSVAHGVCVLHLAGKYAERAECHRAFRSSMRWLFMGFRADIQRKQNRP